MAVTGHKIYNKDNKAIVEQIVDEGQALQYEGNRKDCLLRKKYTDSTDYSFTGFNGLAENVLFAFDDLYDENGDPWADQATLEDFCDTNWGNFNGGGGSPQPKVYRGLVNGGNINGTPQSSGTLTIGQKYRVGTYQDGDDFSNVGGFDSGGNYTFQATGTTPLNWTNGTILTPKNAPIITEIANTLGFTPEFEYQDVGRYAFPIVNTTNNQIWVPNPHNNDISEQNYAVNILKTANDPDSGIRFQYCNLFWDEFGPNATESDDMGDQNIPIEFYIYQ